MSRARLRFKIVSSFAFALLCLVAVARVATSVPLSGAAVAALAVGGLLVAAAAWRGFIYWRVARGAGRS